MRIIVFALLLSAAACGSKTDLTASPTPSAPGRPACIERTPQPPAKEDEAGEQKPDVRVPSGPPPCKLVIQDIHVGDGDEAKEGATVSVHYVGVSWSTGAEFDSSWGGQPASFSLGEVIRGWQEGIPGMKVGGRRRLIIPPDLAYGAQPPAGIAPNETLVFVVDLVSVG